MPRPTGAAQCWNNCNPIKTDCMRRPSNGRVIRPLRQPFVPQRRTQRTTPPYAARFRRRSRFGSQTPSSHTRVTATKTAGTKTIIFRIIVTPPNPATPPSAAPIMASSVVSCRITPSSAEPDGRHVAGPRCQSCSQLFSTDRGPAPRCTYLRNTMTVTGATVRVPLGRRHTTSPPDAS